MTAETTDLVLEILRRIRASQERMELDVTDLKVRMSSVERHAAEIQVQMAAMSVRLDRFDERLGRIERRLDLVDA
jgi:predicted  nucleic acid-binding Zn-ribbon protein